MPSTDFLAGVIEGFYGQPWSAVERLELFEWMARWGLNTYFYAPKDDLKQRAIWREPYSPEEAQALRHLIEACHQRGLRFIYGLSPGLDIRYGLRTDLECLKQRFDQIRTLGCGNFSLLFDDIPDQLDPAELRRWGSLASAQCQVANAVFQWARERCPHARFLFCPTPYCGRMAERKLGGEDYLAAVGRDLAPGIDVFWTGPEIISREIPVAHIEALAGLLRRKPLIWDNLQANDYDGRRFHCGPYAGRPPELLGAVSGLLSNPNTEFPLNFVPLRTLAMFIQGGGVWDPRQAYLTAMREWLPRFSTVSQPVTLEDLVLFGDCYYLPHEEGPEAEQLYQAARVSLGGGPAEREPAARQFREWARRLRTFCVRMTELRDRSLFHSLCRRIWDLREELDLLEGYLQLRSLPEDERQRYHSDTHLPGTYRGGMVARLRRLLVQEADGSFVPKEFDL